MSLKVHPTKELKVEEPEEEYVDSVDFEVDDEIFFISQKSPDVKMQGFRGTKANHVKDMIWRI